MEDDSSSKRNEKTVLETGRPFRPVMFESILKSFTPDVPDNLSGRPRFMHTAASISFWPVLCCYLFTVAKSGLFFPGLDWQKGKDPNFGQRSILTSKILINCLFTSFFLAIKRPTCIYHFKNLNMLAIFTELTKYLNLME